MGQFDFLLNGAQGINVPNPIALGQGALTVGNLANQYQGGQINLLMQRAMLGAMQDPAYASAMGQLFSQAQGGEPAPQGSADMQQWFARNPLGASLAMQQRMSMLTGLSQIGKNNADAAQAEQSMRASIYQQWSGLGSSYGNTKGGVLTDSQKNMFWSLSQRAAGVGAIPQQFLPEIYQHLTSDQDGGKAFLGQLGVAGVNYAEQATGGLAAAKTPGTPGLIAGQTAEANASAAAKPLEAAASAARAAAPGADVVTDVTTGKPQIVRKSPGPEAYLPAAGGAPATAAPTPAGPENYGFPASAGTVPSPYAPADQRAAILQGEYAKVLAQPDSPYRTQNLAALTTEMQRAGIAPAAAASAPAPTPTTGGVGSATPVTGPNGQPVQTALTPAQAALAADTGKGVAGLQAKANAAQQLQQMLIDMRAQDAKGIYSGGIWGTDGAKRLVNILAAGGFLTNEQAAKLRNTQVFDADGQQVIADAVSQFAGARIAARELPFFAGTKPNTQQLASTRTLLYGELYNRAQRIIDQAQQAQNYLHTPGANGSYPNDLGGFNPTFRNVVMPPIDIGNGFTMTPGAH